MLEALEACPTSRLSYDLRASPVVFLGRDRVFLVGLEQLRQTLFFGFARGRFHAGQGRLGRRSWSRAFGLDGFGGVGALSLGLLCFWLCGGSRFTGFFFASTGFFLRLSRFLFRLGLRLGFLTRFEFFPRPS